MRFELIRLSWWLHLMPLDDGEGVISDYNRNSHFFSGNSSQEVAILFLHVMAMLENTLTMLENIVTTLI